MGFDILLPCIKDFIRFVATDTGTTGMAWAKIRMLRASDYSILLVPGVAGIWPPLG